MSAGRLARVAVAGTLILLATLDASAQPRGAPSGDLPGYGALPLDRPSERRLPPVAIEPQPPPPAPLELEPRAPAGATPPASPARQTAEGLTALRTFVRGYRFAGNTAFTDAELAAVTRPWCGREIAFEDIEAARHAVTRWYIEHGFVNSGAILPDQAIRDGMVTLRIVEGRVSRIEIRGTRWFRDAYLRERVRLFAGPPLEVGELQAGLQRLLQDPRIAKLEAELTPDLSPGEAVLQVEVAERIPWALRLAFDNFEPPAVGSNRGTIALTHSNLTGNGDVLDVEYYLTGGLDEVDVGYALPLSVDDTVVSARYRYSEAKVIESPFEPLDIDSRLDTYSVRLGRPFMRGLQRRLLVSLVFDHREARTTLLGQPFSFSAGAIDGKSAVTPLRLELDWLDQMATQVLAARSVFSLGIDALGATVNGPDLPDGEYFAWLLQLQVARQLPWRQSQLLLRADLQLTPNRLLSLEQFVVGGSGSVRGYRQSQLVRDNGATGSLEWRIPIVRRPTDVGTIEIAPFADVGGAWLTHVTQPTATSPGSPSPPSQLLASIGVGLRWLLPRWAEVELYYGYRLVDVPNPYDNPQDRGLSFAVVIDLGFPEAVATAIEPWRRTRPGDQPRT